MQDVSSVFLDALTGSHRPFVKAEVWYDGTIVVPELAIVSGSVSGEDTGDAIRHTLTLDVADADGSLVPRGESAPMAPYGSEIRIRAGIELGSGESETVPFTPFRLESTDADEEWVLYERVDGQVWVHRGAELTLNGVDRAAAVKDSLFIAPEQPSIPGSIRDEIIRITNFTATVGPWPGITDAPVPGSVTYTDDRWAAVCDLAAVLDGVPYIDPYGDLILRPNDDTTSVWTVAAGTLPDGSRGVLVDASTQLTRDGIYNAVVVDGETVNQIPVRAISLETGGVLRWEGPFKRVPFKKSNPLASTVAAAQADADTTLRRQVALRSFPLEVTCVCNYALQIGDTVTIGTPAGDADGRVTRATWPLTPGPMTMTVVVPRDQLWALFGGSGEL